MKKKLLFIGMLLISSSMFVHVLAANPAVDATNYGTREGGKFKLTNKWIFSVAEGNYTGDAKIATANNARGMAAKGGKLLFPSKAEKAILIFNGETGARETPLQLAENVYTYMGRNKANTADSLWTAGLQNNDIHVDGAGNVLISNMVTSATGRFQVWKINMADGTGTVLVDTDIKSHYPDIATNAVRFDAFGVSGDVNGDAVIMALPSASATGAGMEAYQWTITGGTITTQKPKIIQVQSEGQYYFQKKGADGTYPLLKNFGYAPRVLPINAQYFIVDGQATYPTLIQIEELVDDITNTVTYVGNVVDGFYQRLNADGNVEDDTAYRLMKDATTVAGQTFDLTEGHNGLSMFQLGGESFIVMAATAFDKVPKSSFRLFKFASTADLSFKNMTTMWTFPLKSTAETYQGMGGANNGVFTAVPSVEVKDNVANIYLYTQENGYAKYEMEYQTTGLGKVSVSDVEVQVTGKQIIVSEEVARIQVFSIGGQKLLEAANVAQIATPEQQGVYLVNVLDKSGARKVQKVVIR